MCPLLSMVFSVFSFFPILFLYLLFLYFDLIDLCMLPLFVLCSGFSVASSRFSLESWLTILKMYIWLSRLYKNSSAFENLPAFNLFWLLTDPASAETPLALSFQRFSALKISSAFQALSFSVVESLSFCDEVLSD